MSSWQAHPSNFQHCHCKDDLMINCTTTIMLLKKDLACVQVWYMYTLWSWISWCSWRCLALPYWDTFVLRWLLGFFGWYIQEFREEQDSPAGLCGKHTRSCYCDCVRHLYGWAACALDIEINWSSNSILACWVGPWLIIGRLTFHWTICRLTTWRRCWGSICRLWV